TNAYTEIAARIQPRVSNRTKIRECGNRYFRVPIQLAEVIGGLLSGLLHRVELVAAGIVDRADRADLHAHAALRAVLVEREVDLVQEDRVRRARADAGSAVHAQHVVDRHDAVVADRGTDRDDLLRHGGHATPRSAPRTSSRFPR